MLIGVRRFNIYFGTMAMLVVVFCGGCVTTGSPEKNPLAVVSLHIESNPDIPEISSDVPIFRENPLQVNVLKQPFLTETDLNEAKIINVLGGFVIQLKFDTRARWTLEQYTATNPGRRIAVLCRWDRKLKESRWLAAPTISRRISDGTLMFTPDATREESEKIVLGLNNMAKEAARRSNKW